MAFPEQSESDNAETQFAAVHRSPQWMFNQYGNSILRNVKIGQPGFQVQRKPTETGSNNAVLALVAISLVGPPARRTYDPAAGNAPSQQKTTATLQIKNTTKCNVDWVSTCAQQGWSQWLLVSVMIEKNYRHQLACSKN